MKTKTLNKMNTLVLVGLLICGTSRAADQAGSAASHEEHHVDTQAPKKSDESMEMMGKEGMMGQMDMNQMMHECMEMHKDGQMCEHQTMEQCKLKMDETECQKMMKDVKKIQKKSKSKK